MIQKHYTYNEGRQFDSTLRYNGLVSQPYDIIELALLGLMVVENILKLAFTTRLTKKVRQFY